MENEVKNWIMSSLRHGTYSADQLRGMLLKTGFAQQEIEKELAIAAPYIDMMHKVKQKLDVRESLLKTLDQQMRRLPAYLQAEKTALPPLQQFLQEYYYPNRFGVFKNVLERCAAKHWTPASVLEKVGADTMVEIQQGAGTVPVDEQPYVKYKKQVRFGDFISRVEKPGQETDFYYMTAQNYQPNASALEALKQDIMELGDGYLVPDSSKQKMFFWIGPAGTVTSAHFDPSNSLFIQVYGRKRIRLVPALQVPYLYHNKLANSDVDMQKPDTNAYPDFAQATVIDMEVGPGDCVFIPVGWWHHVTSLSTSISVTCANIRIPEGMLNHFVNFNNIYQY